MSDAGYSMLGAGAWGWPREMLWEGGGRGHPAISSSVVPFSSCPHSLPASKSFPMSQLFTWGGQSTGVSALASFLPKKSQGWTPSEWIGWISLPQRSQSSPHQSVRRKQAKSRTNTSSPDVPSDCLTARDAGKCSLSLASKKKRVVKQQTLPQSSINVIICHYPSTSLFIKLSILITTIVKNATSESVCLVSTSSSTI